MDEQELFYPSPPARASKWCTGVTYRGDRLTQPHWAEIERDDYPGAWRGNRCPACISFRRRRRYRDNADSERRNTADWRAANPEYQSEYNREYWAAHRDRLMDNHQAWLDANRDHVAEYRHNRYVEHLDEERESHRRWRRDNRDKVHIRDMARRDRGGNAVCRHGKDCFAKAKRSMPQACVYCGSSDNVEADHWMPLALGGLDCRENLQPLCKSHNSGKRDLHPLEYEARIKFVRTKACSSA